MNQSNEYAPCWMVDHEDGRYSLCFDDFEPTAAFMERHELQGGGYTWEGIVESLVRLHHPELQEVLEYDPEGSMFCVYTRDLSALSTVAALIRQASADEAVLEQAIANADPDLLE